MTNVIIEVTDGYYPSEVSWSIENVTGGVGSTTACLEDGCLTFNMYDFGEMVGTIVTLFLTNLVIYYLMGH